MRPLLLLLATLLSVFAAEDDPVTELLARVKALDGVVDTIAREHADPVDRDRLWAAARAGLVSALDPDSTWLDRGQAAVRAGADRSRRDGYGFDWRPEDGLITRVVANSPAAGAGMVAAVRSIDAVAPMPVFIDATRHRPGLVAMAAGAVLAGWVYAVLTGRGQPPRG